MKKSTQVGTLAATTMVGLAPVVIARRRRQKVVMATLVNRDPARMPSGSIRLSVVVPAFREPRISESVRRLRAALAEVAGEIEIIVVDEGAGDATAAAAAAAGADQVLTLPENRGKGAAVRAGVLVASGQVVAFTDADLSYSPDQLVGLLHEVEAGWDVVAGNREHDATVTSTDTSLLRRAGHRAVALATRVVLVGRHADTQCGLKAFRADSAELLFSHARVDRFAFDVELFHLVERYGLSLTTVGVALENSDESTVRVGRDALQLFIDLARIRWWGHQGMYDVIDVPPDDAPAPVEVRPQRRQTSPPLRRLSTVSSGAEGPPTNCWS